MVKFTKYSDFQKLFKSKRSKITLLICLIIILIIVALAAIFLVSGDHNKSMPSICRKDNYFLGAKTPYRLPEAGSKQEHNASSTKHFPGGLREEQMVPILMWHYIEPLPPFTALPNLYEDPAVFENQIKTLKDNSYNIVLIRDLGESLNGRKVLPSKPIVLTFDDGYEDFYTIVFPLLKKYDIKAVLYVIADAVGKPGYITSAQAKEMANTQYVEIASHTLDHVNLKNTNDYDAYKQLLESKEMLAKMIGRPVDDFAYPFGFFSDRDMNIANRVGYLTAASTYPGVMQSYKNRFTLFRLRPNDRTGEEFLNWLQEEENRK